MVALVPGDAFSGPAGQVASTAAELANKGVDVRFLLLRRPAAATGQLPAFLDRRGLPYEVLDDRGPLDLGLLRRIHARLAGWRPHIVETHGYKATAIALTLRGLRPDWRWVGFFHGLTSESRRARAYHWLDLRMLARADCVIAVSEEQRRRLLHRMREARVIPSAVTTLDAPPGEDTERARAALDRVVRPRIAVVGRLSPEKGVDVFLRAAALLASKGVTFSATIVGDGPERSQLERLAASLGLQDRIQFLGHLSDIRTVYQGAELLVIPSRSEGLPSVLLEALNADVPVVCTRVGAIPEVLRDPDSGILVKAGSPDALAAGIEAGLSSLGSNAARCARAAAARVFSQERRAAALLTIYQEVRRTPVSSA